MNIALSGRPIACWREAFHQIKTVQEQTDCIVPDILEDVGQIVSAQAQLSLKSKEHADHSVRIGAEAGIFVFYITENRERVRCMTFTKPFEITFETGVMAADAAAQISLCTLGVQARAVNPRKIAAQLSIRAELSCWTEGSFTVPSSVAENEQEGLYFLRGSRECVFTTQLCEKSFVVSEQLPLPAEPVPTALSCVRARLVFYDHQPIGSKLLIKGGAELSIGYETQTENCPRFMEQRLPFSVLVDLPDEDCTLGRVILEPTALYTDLGDAINGSRVVEVELHATAQLSFERRETVGFLSDAYSSRFPVKLEENTVPVCLGRAEEALTALASDRVQVGTERGEIVSLFAELLSYSAQEEKAELSASVSMLLQAEDGTYGTQQRLLSLETTLPTPDGEIVSARLTDLRAERRGEEIQLEAAASLEWAHGETAELRCLSAIEADTENAFDRAALPSLTLARRGERELWSLAKLYHSSVEAIEKMEKDFPMTDGLLLIPRV